MIDWKTCSACLVGTILVSACGGGGGGNPENVPPPANNPGVENPAPDLPPEIPAPAPVGIRFSGNWVGGGPDDYSIDLTIMDDGQVWGSWNFVEGTSRTDRPRHSILVGSGSVAADGSFSGTVTEHILSYTQNTESGLVHIGGGGAGPTFAFSTTAHRAGNDFENPVVRWNFQNTENPDERFETGDVMYMLESDQPVTLADAQGSDYGLSMQFTQRNPEDGPGLLFYPLDISATGEISGTSTYANCAVTGQAVPRTGSRALNVTLRYSGSGCVAGSTGADFVGTAFLYPQVSGDPLPGGSPLLPDTLTISGLEGWALQQVNDGQAMAVRFSGAKGIGILPIQPEIPSLPPYVR